MAYGKIKSDTLVYDNNGSDVEVAVSNIATGTVPTNSAIDARADARIAADLASGSPTIQAADPDTAKTDVNQTFTQGQRGEVTALQIVNGVLSPNFNDSNNFSIELNANVTAVNFQNAVAGQSGSIFISQPSSGGPYTVGGWNSAFKFSGGALPTITATNSKTDRVDYVIKSSTEIQVVWTGNY